MPAVTAVGVAIANAHGQATKSSKIAVFISLDIKYAIIERTITVGKNQVVKLSATFCNWCAHILSL